MSYFSNNWNKLLFKTALVFWESEVKYNLYRLKKLNKMAAYYRLRRNYPQFS